MYMHRLDGRLEVILAKWRIKEMFGGMLQAKTLKDRMLINENRLRRDVGHIGVPALVKDFGLYPKKHREPLKNGNWRLFAYLEKLL